MSVASRPLPDPGRRLFDAVLDALAYPLGGAALAANIALLISHLLVMVLPFGTGLAHLLLWLGFYKYALEALATTAEGRDKPPEGWSAVDPGVQWHHHWLQLLLLLAVLAASRLAPESWQLWLLGALSLLMPAMVLTLAVAQNIWTALSPAAWLKLAGLLGSTYLWLALATWPLLWLQARGGPLLDGAGGWRWMAMPLFYFVAQHLTLSLFRLMGLAAHAHGKALGIESVDRSRPVLAREKQQAWEQASAEQALQCEDPAERAAQLAPQLAAGAGETLHQEYRRCLRELGRKNELLAHARVRVCELLNLNQPKQAVQLACEALGDDPAFCPGDAAHCEALARAAERMALLRQAAQLLGNYRVAYPKRFDGLPLAWLAAQWQSERLNQPEVALKLLRAAQPMTASGDEATRYARAIERIQRGQPMTGIDA
ncbi:MAG TPA: hypothetical protein VFY12_10560 [Arenimonas sp.]|nr:hypothetical protein [Arenimonas sp.]